MLICCLNYTKLSLPSLEALGDSKSEYQSPALSLHSTSRVWYALVFKGSLSTICC